MTIWLEHGDMRAVLPRLLHEQAEVHSIVTDPPYHLTTGKKGGSGEASLNLNSPAGRSRISTGGFMGQHWDGGDIAFQYETWRMCYDLLPPGGYLLAFSGTRTYHRMAVAIEEAGFEIRDMLTWIYGQGFPKSKNIGNGWGTALKPAMEPICVARKPLDGTVAANVLKYGVGALNIDRCRVPTNGDDSGSWCDGRRAGGFANIGADKGSSKPNGTKHDAGRWPANIIHDGSDEVVNGFPPPSRPPDKTRNTYGKFNGVENPEGIGATSGNASRFFYCAKANAKERMGFDHPTVKPIALLRWLTRLVTPPGGVVLDPFAGTGTMGAACEAEGFDAILVEREEKYAGFIQQRLPAAQLTVHP